MLGSTEVTRGAAGGAPLQPSPDRPHVATGANPARASHRAARVARHHVAGGREHGGGIGRLVGYIIDEAAKRDETHVVTDTRGPKMSLASPVRLGLAILAVARDRIAEPARIQHIHVAGRGSTVRKLALAGACRLLGSTHIMHLHDPEYADDVARRPAAMRAAIARMFRGADRVVVLGLRDRGIVTGVLGADAGRVDVLHNAVPRPASPRAPRLPDGRVKILFLGRLSERKGVPDLVAALASERMQGLDWSATLAGDGPVDEFRAEVVASGIGDRVRLPGWVAQAEVARLCSEADILVLPSHAEGMAMAVLEGMAHGLAVVTTRVGAHEEVMVDGETGVFVQPGDPAGLADALATLVLDAPRRARLGFRARDHFARTLGIAAYLGKLDRVYDAVRAGRSRP